MAAPIQSPAKCEVPSVIRFLNAKGERSSAVQSGPRSQRFPLFFHLEKYLVGKNFDDDDVVQEEVMT